MLLLNLKVTYLFSYATYIQQQRMMQIEKTNRFEGKN